MVSPPYGCFYAIGRCAQFNLDLGYRNREMKILSDS